MAAASQPATRPGPKPGPAFELVAVEGVGRVWDQGGRAKRPTFPDSEWWWAACCSVAAISVSFRRCWREDGVFDWFTKQLSRERPLIVTASAPAHQISPHPPKRCPLG